MYALIGLAASTCTHGTCRRKSTRNSTVATGSTHSSGVNHGPRGAAWRPMGPPNPGSIALITAQL